MSITSTMLSLKSAEEQEWKELYTYIIMLEHREKELKWFNDILEKQNLDKAKEIERLNKERKAIKKYVHNHTITYIENGIECCKPDEYFNICWVEDMLNGNFENLEILFEGSDEE